MSCTWTPKMHSSGQQRAVFGSLLICMHSRSPHSPRAHLFTNSHARLHQEHDTRWIHEQVGMIAPQLSGIC